MHTTVIGSVVAHFKFVKVGTALKHPVKHGFKANLFGWHWYKVVFFPLLLSEVSLVFHFFVLAVVQLYSLVEQFNCFVDGTLLADQLKVGQTLSEVGL